MKVLRFFVQFHNFFLPYNTRCDVMMTIFADDVGRQTTKYGQQQEDEEEFN